MSPIIQGGTTPAGTRNQLLPDRPDISGRQGRCRSKHADVRDLGLIRVPGSGLHPFLLVLAILLPALGAGAQPSKSLPNNLRTLTTLREAHSLSAEEAKRGYPIHLQAVVTYYDPFIDSRRIALFVHDATGSMYVAVPIGFISPGGPPRAGTIVDVSGISAPGDFAPIIDQSRISVIGLSHIPDDAKRVSMSHLLTGTEDGQWVEIEGVVQSVFQTAANVTLEVAMADGTIGATTVKEAGADYTHLVDARVRIHGNAAPLFNSDSQMTGVRLLFPSLDAVTVVEPAPPDPFALAVRPISSLSRFTPTTAWPHRIHVRGSVTLQWPGRTVCIQDDSQGLCAQSSQETLLAVGSLADLVGFTTLAGFRPSLVDAMFKPLGGNVTVAASPVTPEQALQGSHDADLVQIEGQLIGRDLAAKDTTLILSSGKSIFRVIFPSGLAGSDLPAISIGSKLRITGICSVQVDAHGTLQGYGTTQTSQFWILLRSPQDVVVLQMPAWWTTFRMLLVLAFVLTMMAAVFGWVFVLRRRVEQQTRMLRESKERYRHMAQHDALTGLPTRMLMHDRLRTALERAKRFKTGVALLMLDLDKFKQVNDSLGHDGGDRVLCITAQRITDTIRKTDSVARMGGDEFIVLLSDLTEAGQAELIAAKLVVALSMPIQIGSREVPVSASVGVCTICDGAADAEVLLQRVDAAMYHAKAQGRSCFQVFTSDMAGATRNHPGTDVPDQCLVVH